MLRFKITLLTAGISSSCFLNTYYAKPELELEFWQCQQAEPVRPNKETAGVRPLSDGLRRFPLPAAVLGERQN